MICGHGHEQKFKYPYLRDSKIIQMPYPRAKAIDQNPAPCPAFHFNSWSANALINRLWKHTTTLCMTSLLKGTAGRTFSYMHASSGFAEAAGTKLCKGNVEEIADVELDDAGTYPL